MDNKLIELSKPVAWTDREELAFVNDMACMWTEGMGINEEPLYSQEYVSSLIADNEALKIRVGQQQSVAANNLDMFRNADARAESLLAELEASKTNAEYYKSAFEEQRDHADMLEKRLATPVRLPELCGDGENDNEYTEGLNDGINQSAKAVRAAGFTVEGDE